MLLGIFKMIATSGDPPFTNSWIRPWLGYLPKKRVQQQKNAKGKFIVLENVKKT